MNALRSKKKRQFWLILGGVILAMLVAAVFTLGSLNLPVRPQEGNALVIFFALSTICAAALLVFGLILTRSLLRIWEERRSGQMGSRFKVKMVAGAMGVTLLPLVFLFVVSYSLVNRTLNAWFPKPLEIANQKSQDLFSDMRDDIVTRLNGIAANAVQSGAPDDSASELMWSADACWTESKSGAVTGVAYFKPAANAGVSATVIRQNITPVRVHQVSDDLDIWKTDDQLFIAGSAPWNGGKFYVARELPGDFLDRYSDVEAQTAAYLQQKQNLRAYKRQILLQLSLMTVILISTTTWVALKLSKQVTVPIQGLAEATREISRGNFDHRITVQAQDELGTLVRSFNRMTEQLGEGRRQINEFTQSLEQAIEERERRRKLMEAILENIPTGVVSLDASGNVSRVNTAVATILGDSARTAQTLPELVGDEASRAMLHMMRRSLRMGAASSEIEIATGGRLVRTAVTVTSLGPRRSNPGFIVVIDDLTDLLQAQKTAAWQEVAQRIAHEIKNPLTPIQLSAQRLLRFLDRAATANPSAQRTEFEKLSAECAGLIEREVQTLESLVDEFSQFARFPAARLAPADVNTIVESALELFQGRLDGIVVSTDLAESLPAVKADAELIRQVVANLIDNAAESMEGATVRRLRVSTRTESDGDAVVIEISDSGHGISPADKEKRFLPHFSTKGRGTGLGLAIASRIIAEHNGTMRVEDNSPIGARFLIRFPAAEVGISTQAG